jgi:hypothetical protein
MAAAVEKQVFPLSENRRFPPVFNGDAVTNLTSAASAMLGYSPDK